MSGPQVLAVIVIFVAFCLTLGWYAKRGVEREAEQTGRALTLGPDVEVRTTWDECGCDIHPDREVEVPPDEFPGVRL